MEPNGPLSRLKSVIISVYRHSLLFLGYMIQVHGKAQILGTATAAFRLPTVDKYLQALRDSDKDLSQAASDSDKTVNLEHRTKHIQDIQAALGDITKLHKTLQNFM